MGLGRGGYKLAGAKIVYFSFGFFFFFFPPPSLPTTVPY